MRKWILRIFKKILFVIKIILWKISLTVLYNQLLKKWFERVIQLYEIEQIKRENDTLHGKLEVRTINFRHYLPHTRERIERLRRVINKRPVAIVLHGPSVKELEERISDLKDCDICYFGLNAFSIPEEHILQKINRNFSLILYTAIRSGADSQMDKVIDFLERPENNIFISDRNSFYPWEKNEGFDLDKFIKKHDRKLLFITVPYATNILVGNSNISLQIPSIECPLHFPPQNSFSVLLSLAIIGEAPVVTVFGGDGGRINNHELYFRETAPPGDPESIVEELLMRDTKVFNLTMPLLLEKLHKIYDIRPIDIINCSIYSRYTPLRKLSYDETFALLQSFKYGQ